MGAEIGGARKKPSNAASVCVLRDGNSNDLRDLADARQLRENASPCKVSSRDLKGATLAW